MYNLNVKPEYESNVVKAGEYECYIANAELKESKSGKPYIALDFVIRNDVNQDFKNSHIYGSVFKTNVYSRNGKRIRKSTYDSLPPVEKSQVIVTEEFQDMKIRPLLEAQDADGDERTTNFNSIEEIILFLNGMNVRITVEVKEPDDFHEGEWNDINYRGISRTQYSTKLVATGPAPQIMNIDDRDLPF